MWLTAGRRQQGQDGDVGMVLTRTLDRLEADNTLDEQQSDPMKERCYLAVALLGKEAQGESRH